MVGGAFVVMFILWLIMFHPLWLIVGIAIGALIAIYCILWFLHKIFIEKEK